MASSKEERLLTLYADVHYYFSEPGPRPTHHRFDRESYVYLYRDSSSGRGRIEIANHAGTAEQDAFTGYLDNVSVEQTCRHPTLCVMKVDGAGTTAQPENHWRLPSTDPRDEGSFLFKLHTIELYFWTEADAAQFVHAIATTLRKEQIGGVDASLLAASSVVHEQPVSSVVQNLENLAVSHGKSASQQVKAPQGQTNDLSHAQSNSPASGAVRDSQADRVATANDQNKAPLAYNPAAPAPPEKHSHREKTPPPPEGAEGTGLAAAAARDSGRPPLQTSGPSFGPTATPSFGPGAPSTIHSPGATSPLGGPHPAHPFSPAPSSMSPGPPTSNAATPMSNVSQTHQSPPSFPGPPTRTNTEHSIGGLPGRTPTNEILGPDFRQPGVPLQHLQPQYPDYLAQRVGQNTPPSTHSQGYHAPGEHVHRDHKLPENVRIGGYSDHNYQSPPPASSPGSGYADGNPYGTGDYAIHQQAYRPTEDEARVHSSHSGRRSSRPKPESEERPGRLEAGAEKVEKKVNKFLRGLEKRIG